MLGRDGTGPPASGGGERNRESGTGRGSLAGPVSVCRCLKCGKVVTHQGGVPCNLTLCPDCGILMVRND